MFWKQKDAEYFDSAVMNFVRVMAANHYAVSASRQSKDQKIDLKKGLHILIGKENANSGIEDNEQISFTDFLDLECLDVAFVKFLISLLDQLSGDQGKLVRFLKENSQINEEELFGKVLDNDLSYAKRIQVYGLFTFIVQYGVSEGISDWARVLFNLTENTIYNEVTEFARDLSEVQRLLPYAENILAHLADRHPITGFYRAQVLEEQIKAQLMLMHTDWDVAIRKAERHGFFKGQIGFLLEFSGTWKTYDKEGTTSNFDKTLLQSFQNYNSKFESVFGSDGLRPFKDYVFERALLTKGSYFLRKNSNYSLLNNRDRDASWKRMLRGFDSSDLENNRKRNQLKDLVDDPLFDLNQPEVSLEQIRKSGQVGRTDWRYYFIEFPEIFRYCERSLIRFHSEHHIYLLWGERMSGVHHEYYTYGLYLERINSKSFAPFTSVFYYDVSGDSEEPCIVLNDASVNGKSLEIDIYYNTEHKKYALYIYALEGEKLGKKLSEGLEALDLEQNKDGYFKYLSGGSVGSTLRAICEFLEEAK